MAEKLPIGCTARYNEILHRARELLETFINGNRKYTVQELEGMEPRAALAVLSEMMIRSSPVEQEDLNRFLKEVT